VLARLAEPGQTVAAGTPVILLGEFSSGFVLRVPLSAADAAGLQRGVSANVVFRDGAAPPMAARVIEIAGRADPRTGTFQVEFALPPTRRCGPA
jgi:multidrug efflux pump subunit AcrA (membrane-fusion protein)